MKDFVFFLGFNKLNKVNKVSNLKNLIGAYKLVLQNRSSGNLRGNIEVCKALINFLNLKAGLKNFDLNLFSLFKAKLSGYKVRFI